MSLDKTIVYPLFFPSRMNWTILYGPIKKKNRNCRKQQPCVTPYIHNLSYILMQFATTFFFSKVSSIMVAVLFSKVSKKTTNLIITITYNLIIYIYTYIFFCELFYMHSSNNFLDYISNQVS